MFENKRKPNIEIKSNFSENDLTKSPVLIIGQKKHLLELKYDEIKCKFGNKNLKDEWDTAVKLLSSGPNDSIPLYLNQAIVASLPNKISRHNTPSRAHSITKLVKSKAHNKDECIIILCEKENVFASVCAIARAYPSFSKRTSGNGCNFTVTIEVSIIDSKEDLITQEVHSALKYAIEGIRLAAHIVDTPADEMNTDAFVELVKDVGKELGIKPKILRGQELKDGGFGGIYGVGKAANCPPALAILSHTPPGATESIAWVGKGIVFDTGGLGLKAKLSMLGMKRDCGGAAAILGGFYAAVKSGFTADLHALFCIAENSVGPDATKPDDIHKLYSGRTVEINNTDAEGRLVLGDGVAYAAKTLRCSTILDMATLTGAQGVATGRYHGAILTNNEEWEDKGVKAGRISGDLLHPIVFSPELHFSEFNSTLADMKNSVSDRMNATSSCAGLFIFSHIGFDWKGSWMHVDMAYPVHNGERATGYGVGLLLTMFSSYSSNKFVEGLFPESYKMDNGAQKEGSANKKMKMF